MEAYLAGLPGGLSSYPNHRQKATVFRAFIEGIDLTPYAAQLPTRLAVLIAKPPSPHSWLTEVEATAVYLALIDLVFQDEERFIAHAYERNRQLLDGPLYRILFRLAGKERLARGMASRWGTMHTGIALIAMAIPGRSEATVRLEFPAGLIPPVIARCYVTALRAAFEVAGARDVVFELVEESPTLLELRGRWT